MAKLLDGTRIYGTANVDTRVNVGANVFTNTSVLSIGPFGTTNGALITTTSVDIGNTTANAALDYNIIYVANSTGRANLTPTTLAIGSITVNSALANLQALNVVNQTNTGTLYVTTSANVGTAFTVNSTSIVGVANVNIDSGVLSVDTVLNRVGVNTALTSLGDGGIGVGVLSITSGAGATAAIHTTAASHFLRILPNMGAGSFNNITAAGDSGIIFSNGTSGFGNLVIAPWISSTLGIKINASANSITIAGNTVNISTSLSIGSITVNSALANLQALNVVNQTNTGTLYVTTSANVGTAFTANSTSVNSTVNTAIAAIIANGSIGTSGQVLTSNATGIYWSTVTGGSANPGGSDTQVQFNDGGTTFGATAGFTFNKTTNTVTIGNTITVGTTSTVNGSLANLQALNVVNQTNTATLFVTTSANVGTAAVINSVGITHTGFANITGAVNAASHTVGTALIANSTGVYHTGTMNAASFTVGTITAVNSTTISLGPFGVTNGALITTTSVDIGNTTANAALDYNVIYVANSTGRANLTPTVFSIGNSTINTTANSTVVLVNGVDRLATQKRSIAMSLVFGR